MNNDILLLTSRDFVIDILSILYFNFLCIFNHLYDLLFFHGRNCELKGDVSDNPERAPLIVFTTLALLLL